jgi:hypothetical protein
VTLPSPRRICQRVLREKGHNWQVLGAISVSGAASLLSEADLSKFAKRVSAAAKRASRALGSRFVHRLQH